MAEFLITAPDGKKYKITGATREGALAALKKRLKPQPNQQPVTGDTSFGTALKVGDAQAQSLSQSGAASLQRNLSDGMFGDAQRYLTENIANPVRETFGFDPIDIDAVNQAETKRLEKAAELSAEAAQKLQDDLNFKNLTTGDIRDIPSFVNFVSQKTAQALPYMGAALASGGTLTYPFGVGEISQSLDEIEGLDQAQKDDIAAAGGAIMTVLENLGIAKLLPNGISTSVIGGISKGFITEGTTEGLQELVVIGSEALAGKQFSEEEIINRLKESVAAGGAVGSSIKATSNTATKLKSLFTGEGNLVDPNSIDADQKQAAASVAKIIRQVANQNGYNLSDVNPSSSKGAKQALEATHENISEQIKQIAGNKVIKDLLSPKKASTLDQLIDDYTAAQVALRQGKNKVKSKVTEENYAAIMRLLPDSAEKTQIANLLKMSNQVTDLFNNGLKGGISQYTDYFNPLATSGGVYDPTRIANIILGAGGAFQSGGSTLGIAAGGRLVDAVTGRRSAVNRFTQQNENRPGLEAPSGTSLIQSQADAEAAAQQRAEQEVLLKDQREAELKETNQKLAQVNAPPTQGSPQDTLEVATGLNRDNVARILRILKSRTDTSPILLRAIEGYEKSVGEGGKPPDLNPLIRAVRQFQRDNPSYSPLDFRPGDPDRVPLIDGQSPNRVNVDPTSPTQPQGGDEFGPQFTTPQNYNRGIEDNKAFRQDLENRVLMNPDIKGDEQIRLLSSLVYLRDNLGSSPVQNALQEIQDLEDSGVVSQENIDTYVRPYVNRIIKQQRRNAPKMALAPEEDAFDYRMQHQPHSPEDGAAPLWDMTGGGQVFPDDIYGPNGLRYYGNPNSQADRESYDVISSVMDNPDAEVTIYRAVPNEADIDTINVGDFVTLSRTYAEQHAESGYGPLGQDRGKVLSKMVKAKDIFSDGNDLNEFGYFPKTQPRSEVPTNDPKRPQAPLLDPQLIPEQTRTVYKLMKVQKKRPGEVLPLYARSGGDKGPASGYSLGKWYASEFQRPKIGNKLLSPRSGIHGVELPVFDQGKAKVSGEQRVWVEVEMPVINPETQALSDASLNPDRGVNEGILNRNLDPNESYDFKTNPNASQDARGWPIAGSMRPIRILDDAEVSQILRDNGLENQVDNSFTGVDAAKAQELMQPQTPVRMAMATQEDIPVPRGETTNIQMPNTLGTAFEFAKNSNFRTGRDFKVALQEAALKAQKEEGIDLSELSEENANRLADYVVADALEALKDNSNAIGWYDRTVTDALNTLSEIYPEIQTNPKNKLQFIWALAVTSNGTKVDKNFELAANAYDHLQRTGRFPTDIGIGNAARAINGGLQQYHTMMDKFERKTNSDEGDHQLLADFMNSQVPVKQIEQEYGVKISGEGKGTLVRGASILGPKIGNGFFSNLYGNFDALTMDRWLMRTVGRHRGTLININMPMVKKKTGEIKTMLKGASPETMKGLRRIFKPTGTKVGKNLSTEQVYQLAARIAKESASKPWRENLNGVSEDLRKAGNALAKYLDGQVEAPAGARERNFIRSVFQQALGRLNSEPTVTRASNTGLTMSDLQALLWYPEKRLYDSSKAPKGQDSRGYADDEAPDYANAARKLVESRKGSPSGSGLGYARTAGDGRRGTARPNARPALAPVQDNVAGVLAQRIQGGPTRRSPVPSTQEVKQAAGPVRALIEVGKPGGEFENGIKDINQVRKLADAIGITLNMYDNHFDMEVDAENYGRFLGLYRPDTQTAFAMSPVKDEVDIGDVSEFQSYIIALHEVAHGVNDMSNDAFDAPYGAYSANNAMTKQEDEVRQGSFDGLMARIAMVADKPKHPTAKVVKEIKKLQDKGKYDGGSDIRYTGGAKRNERARRGSPYYNYIRGASEFGVDPVVFYLHNPKRMKKEFPETAKMISQFFAKSGKINFYSHPLAMAIAVVFAMLMKQEQEDEERRMMPPPGALNQPMQPGALSA